MMQQGTGQGDPSLVVAQHHDTRTYRFLIAALVLLLGAGLLSYSPLTRADPVIRWTPPSVTQEVARDQTTTISVSFVASETVSDVAIRVVPELQPFIQITPATFSVVPKGTATHLTLTIAASATAEIRAIDGVIQIRRSAKPEKTLQNRYP
ncbi:MAG: hypothetical protein ACREXS_04335 [Gammaproteobacteria bacterium]